MTIEVRPFTTGGAAAHCAGEDELIVCWFTGGYGDVEGTLEYFEWLASKAEVVLSALSGTGVAELSGPTCDTRGLACRRQLAPPGRVGEHDRPQRLEGPGWGGVGWSCSRPSG